MRTLLLSILLLSSSVFAAEKLEWIDAYGIAYSERKDELTISLYEKKLIEAFEGKSELDKVAISRNETGSFAQCSMFRYAQGMSVTRSGADKYRIEGFTKKADEHLYEFIALTVALEYVLDQEGFADAQMKLLEQARQAMYDKHTDSMAYNTDARKQWYDWHERGCTNVESSINMIQEDVEILLLMHNFDPRIEELMNP